SEPGFFFLVNSEGNGNLNPNANDLNDPYYADFNQENRYYNFALNLGTGAGEGAADFANTYAGLSNADAVFVAYENIVGTAAAISAGIDPTAARADIVGRFDFFRAVAIERGGIADTPANAAAIDLAAKAVMVAYLLNEAFKASVGNLVDSFERFLLDLGVDGDATFGSDVIGAYPGADANMEFTLTSGADAGAAFTGGSGDDTFFGTEDTLTSTDILKGGDGDDQLIIATSGGSDVVLAGFDTESIEKFQLTSDAGSTRLDVSGAEDLQSIVNTNSSSDVTLTGMVPTIAVTIENTTQDNGGGSVNTNIQYIASATAGDNTRQQITLINVIDPVFEVGQTAISLTGNADNVEIIDLISAGNKENILTNLDSLSLDEVTVAGNADLTVQAVGFDAAANVFNAAQLTGDLDVTFNTSGVNDVAATGGSGDDRFDYQAGFDAGDSVDGGAGTDHLVLNVDTGIEQGYDDDGDAANPARGTATNVEIVTLAAGSFDQSINMANLGAALTTFNVNTGVNGSVLLANLRSTTTVVVDHNVANLNGDHLTVDFLGDTSTDALNLTINNLGGGGTGDGLLTLADDDIANNPDDDSLDVLNLVINDDAAGGELVLSLEDLDNLATWNISGDADLDADSGAGDTGALATVNGSTSTGNIDLTDVTFGWSLLNGRGISITTGSGNDTIGTSAGSIATASLIGNDTISTGAGADVVWSGLGADNVSLGSGTDFAHGMQGDDVLDGGDGNDTLVGGFGLDTLTGGAGADTFTYNLIAESQGVDVDVITDFQSGVDVINLLAALQAANPLVIDSSDVAFVGVATTFGNAVTELTAGGGVEAVFVQNANPGVPGAGILYVDVNGDGNIDTAQDMAIQLNNVSTITAADIQATFVPVTFTAAQPAFDTSAPATSEEGNVTQNNVNDGIYTTWAFLAGSTVDGGDTDATPELDILNVTDVATGGDLDFYAFSISNIDRLNLRGGTTALVTAPDIDDLVINLGPAGGIVATDGGADNQTVNGSNLAADDVTLNGTTDSANTRGGNDNITIAGITFTGSVNGGDGADNVDLANAANIVGATLSNVETLTLLANTATISVAQHAAFVGANLIAGAAANTLTVVGPGSIVADGDVENYVLADSGPLVDDAQNFTLHVNTDSVNAGDGDDTIQSNLAAYATVTVNGGAGTDTFRVNVNSDLATVSFSNMETLSLAGGITGDMSAAQHGNFSAGVEDFSSTLDITGPLNDTTFDISRYNLDQGGSVSDTINVGADGTSIFASGAAADAFTVNGRASTYIQGGAGNDTFALTNDTNTEIDTGAGINTVTLTGSSGVHIDNEGTTNLTINGTVTGTIHTLIGGTVYNITLNNGSDITGVDFDGNYVPATDSITFQSGGTFTMSDVNYDTLIADAQTAAGDETVRISDVASITADTTLGNEIENYVFLNNTGPNSFTIDLASAANVDYDLDMTAGGTDTINIANTFDANVNNASLDVTGFTAGVGGDVIDWDNGAVELDAFFQSVPAASGGVLAAGEGSIVEVTGASIIAASSTDVTAGGAVEAAIAAALGDVNNGGLANGQDIGVILYDAAGTAYLYAVNVATASDDLIVTDFEVELIGTFNGVGVNSFDGTNFI
ncbi:MAG: hypothetical protein IT546_11870, partial [Caulobacteraceae bacterium]|nr:hypothetical protein [Caulobacteraceae bacterium]